jgi:hypothetical protein
MAKRSGRMTRDHRAKIRSLVQGRTDGQWVFTVTGYAVERSSLRKNIRLAKRRANSAARLLRKAGVPPAALIVKHKVPLGKRDRGTAWRKVTISAKYKGKGS